MAAETMMMKTSLEWMLVENSKLQELRQRQCNIWQSRAWDYQVTVWRQM